MVFGFFMGCKAVLNDMPSKIVLLRTVPSQSHQKIIDFTLQKLQGYYFSPLNSFFRPACA
jgi:hypothetical protein